MEYTYNEALILQEYYKDKIVGKTINESFKNTVTEIAIQELKNGKYLVTPGFWVNNSDFIYIEINKAVKMFDLIPTKQVLLTHQY